MNTFLAPTGVGGEADSIIPFVPPSTDDSELQYMIIGHVTKDLAPEGDRMGGTAAYSGLTALAYGASVSLLTACSPECDLSPLDGIRIQKIPSGKTTVFENRYRGSVREQWIRSTAEPLGPMHIPPGWNSPAIVHFGPVVGEADPGLMNRFGQSLRCVTLQGWMREWDSGGRVRVVLRPEAERAARNADAAVFSLDDVGGSEPEAARLAGLSPVAAVTDGERGCRVFRKGETRDFPAPKVMPADPTGAGDIFAAVFFLRLKETGNAWEAGRMAVALASLSVTRPGLAGVPTRSEILEAKQAGEPL
jgi:hypothetical protein